MFIKPPQGYTYPTPGIWSPRVLRFDATESDRECLRTLSLSIPCIGLSVVEIRDNGIDLPSVGKCSPLHSRLLFLPYGVS